jgi:hypothetical protein
VQHCRGLTAAEFGSAVQHAYQIEFGRRLPDVSSSRNMPPASFRAKSAQAAALRR